MSTWRRQQYEHNKAVCEALDPTQFPDWVITCLFYAALVLVDEVFEKYRGQVPFSHKERTALVGADARTRRIEPEYVHLKQLSENARYSYPHTAFGSAQTDQAKLCLQAVEDELLPRIT